MSIKDLSLKDVSNEIIILRESYVDGKFIKKISDINRSVCFGFAEDIVGILWEKFNDEVPNRFMPSIYDNTWCESKEVDNEKFQMIRNEDFKVFADDNDDIGVWDIKALEAWNIKLPHGLSLDELNKVPFGYHVFTAYKGLFFDAESPEGVDNFFDLELYKETLQIYLKEKEN